MSLMTCQTVVEELGAFVDDELSGARRLAVAEHLSRCQCCAAEGTALRDVGQALRLESEYIPTSDDLLGGLVGSVLSRTRAEQAQSWLALWRRAVDDWHWAAVGLGSVTGALVSFVAVSAMVFPSISRLTQMNASAGTLYLMALPEDGRGRPVMMEYERGAGAEDPQWALPASFGVGAERALVIELDAVLIRSGRPTSLQGLSKVDREDILALLSEILNLRYQSVQRPGQPASVVGVTLQVETFVSAPGP
jgi:hypothetical protein